MKRFKIIQKIPAQRREKAGTQGTREDRHIGYCIHTSESSNVKVHNVYHGKQHYVYKNLQLQNTCKIIYPRNIVCFRYIIVNTLHTGDKK